MSFARRKFLLFFFVLILIFDAISCKRGGGGFGGGGRGASAARGGFGRGTSGSRSGGGGIFGSSASRNTYSKPNYGGGFKAHTDDGSKLKDRSKSSYMKAPTYTKGSGIGSKLRSNTFKNMIVGAAAGYLTYQAGKAIIRHAAGPMMWNNRPYYWGSNYYRPQYPNQPVCRMPLDESDPHFGNIHFQDNTRPREIVWGCGVNEHCCGYECCPGSAYGGGGYGGGYGYGYGNSATRGIGTLLVFLILCCCCAYPIYRICRRHYHGGSANPTTWFRGNKYVAPPKVREYSAANDFPQCTTNEATYPATSQKCA